MADNANLSSEDKELLRAVIRKRQPSMIWTLTHDQPLTPAQRDVIKGMLTDELRETGSMTERGAALKKLVDQIGQI